MKLVPVIIVRIYITEKSHLLNKIMDCLKNEAKIKGVSVFRAISGYGGTGVHASNLVDFSLDLPLALEFFDTDKEKIENALNQLSSLVKAEHIITWEAKTIL